jgi:uncharacterized membrane protein YcaP (DUF421 family)
LIVVLIADASQNAMAGDYHSILDGLVLVLTLVFWNYLLDWLTLHSKRIERFTYPPPIPLVQDRRMNDANMRNLFITRDQLLSMLREHGIDDPAKVKAAYIEGSGHISVIPLEEKDGKKADDDPRRRQVV